MKVIVTDEVAGEGLALLEQDPRIEMDVRLNLKKEELLAIIGGYEILITRSGTTVDRELLDAAGKLKMVARAGVGIDNVDVDYASAKGVIVVNAPFGNTNSAAEHAMALLLAVTPVRASEISANFGAWLAGVPPRARAELIAELQLVPSFEGHEEEYFQSARVLRDDAHGDVARGIAGAQVHDRLVVERYWLASEQVFDLHVLDL